MRTATQTLRVGECEAASTFKRAGFTMIEVLLALGLLSILIVALVRLLDTSLTILDRTEVARDLQEMSSSVLDLVAEDVYALEVTYDLDGEIVSYEPFATGWLQGESVSGRPVDLLHPPVILGRVLMQAIGPAGRGGRVEVALRVEDHVLRRLGVLLGVGRARHPVVAEFDERGVRRYDEVALVVERHAAGGVG